MLNASRRGLARKSLGALQPGAQLFRIATSSAFQKKLEEAVSTQPPCSRGCKDSSGSCTREANPGVGRWPGGFCKIQPEGTGPRASKALGQRREASWAPGACAWWTMLRTGEGRGEGSRQRHEGHHTGPHRSDVMSLLALVLHPWPVPEAVVPLCEQPPHIPPSIPHHLTGKAAPLLLD